MTSDPLVLDRQLALLARRLDEVVLALDELARATGAARDAASWTASRVRMLAEDRDWARSGG